MQWPAFDILSENSLSCRHLLVASVFKAEEDGCYIFVHVHACV